MTYQKNTWIDRVGTGLNKFTDQDGKTYAFTPTPDSISSVGTPFSADWMNNLENGVEFNNSVTSKIGVTLWTGEWSSGNITVSGITNYTMIIAKVLLNSVFLIRRSNGVFQGLGGGIISASSSNLPIVSVYVNSSNDTLTYGNVKQFNFSGDSSGNVSWIVNNNLTITEIIGIF